MEFVVVGGSCYNEFPDDSVCIDLAQSGECALSPEWMGRYCRKACDACDGNELPIGKLHCSNPFPLSIEHIIYQELPPVYAAKDNSKVCESKHTRIQ